MAKKTSYISFLSYLTQEQKDTLNEYSERTGISSAEMMRQALSLYFTEMKPKFDKIFPAKNGEKK